MTNSNKNIILLILIAGCFLFSAAKEGWMPDVYEFGVIEESDGPRQGRFSYVNTSDSSKVINNVRPTCGCTTVDFTQEVINPGDTASLVFEFNPEGRPGKFDKNIKVYLSGESSPISLSFSGIVKASEKTLTYRFPVGEGHIRMETDEIKAGELPKGSRKHAFVGIYNNSEELLTPHVTTDSDIVNINLVPKVLEAYESCSLSIFIDTRKISQTGFQECEVRISSEEYPEEEQLLRISLFITNP